jgi:hypothetical protein
MQVPLPATAAAVSYRTVNVAGINLFYREAGPPDASTVLLRTGWSSSSHMFRDLIPKLADRFHLVAEGGLSIVIRFLIHPSTENGPEP